MSFQTQAICLNGHQLQTTLKWNFKFNPEQYCKYCGQLVITQCPNPNCRYTIPGNYKIDGVADLSKPYAEIPNYCISCSHPYPWTVLKIEAVKELIELSELSKDEKIELTESVPDILSETPKTKVATTKFKIYSAKAGKIVGESIRQFVIDFGVEFAKKTFLNN